MNVPTERLYELLPAVYRSRDAENGEPLRAFLGVLETVLAQIEDDVDALYDDWFIETCQERLVPYLAELLGTRDVLREQHETRSQRAFVANTSGYRRRPGTPATLRALAEDITGWQVRVVDWLDRVAMTQHLTNARSDRARLPDLRLRSELDWIDTPFEKQARTIDVHLPGRRGNANLVSLGTIGLFVWRLQSYPLARTTPASVAPERYTFHPLGIDAPLFALPRAEASAADAGLPAPLRRHPLAQELDRLRAAHETEDRLAQATYFGDEPVFEVFVADESVPLDPGRLAVADLSSWARTPTTPHVDVIVDPVLGRILCRPGVEVSAVSSAYGFSGDLGGGPYPRMEIADKAAGRAIDWRARVGRHLSSSPDDGTFASLPEAIQAWNSRTVPRGGGSGLIAIADSATHADPGSALEIHLAAGSRLVISAGDWIEDDDPLTISELYSDGWRPCLRGELRVHADTTTAAAAGQLILRGLLLEGPLTIDRGHLGLVRLEHCTLKPGGTGLTVPHGGDRLRLELEACIVGRLALADDVPELRLRRCLVQQADGEAIRGLSAQAGIFGTTVLGATRVNRLDAADSIFRGRLHVHHRHPGSLRHSYAPPGSRTPPRVSCPPEHPDMRPAFTSEVYGDPAYGQLSASCAPEIATGASDDGEMGAFHHLHQARRAGRLGAALDRHIPLGMRVAVFDVT